jgi:hypothetical protein
MRVASAMREHVDATMRVAFAVRRCRCDDEHGIGDERRCRCDDKCGIDDEKRSCASAPFVFL